MFITFEDMRLEHVSQVAKIEKASFPTPWSPYTFTCELMQNDFSYYIVAMAGGQVVGYGGMWLILDEAHITNVAVSPACRGKSIGKALMMQIIGRAALMGVKSMTLEVRPSNTGARKLYADLGFVEKGVRKRYYIDNGEDAIIMWKEGIGGENDKGNAY